MTPERLEELRTHYGRANAAGNVRLEVIAELFEHIDTLSTDRDAALSRADRAEEGLTAIRNLCANWANSPDFNPTLTEAHELASTALSSLKAPRS